MPTELERWSEVHADAVKITEFLEFLAGKGISIEKIDYTEVGTMYFAQRPSNDELIYQHFGINSIKLEKERRRLLVDLRK